jgi:LuxR family transcriptional regulator, maltose regulon positive regulatory protein
VTSGRVGGSAAAVAFALAEAKLRPPPARPGIVHRSALVDRLSTAEAPPVISVVAPAGYGKSTLLAQWAERQRPRAGWVSVDERDNDPAVLLAYIATALDRIEPIGPAVFRGLASPDAAVRVPVLLASAIAAMDGPVSLVIDHLEQITERDSLDAVAHLALGLPTESRLAIGSRDRLPLPTARLRAQGGIVEVGPEDLAMDESDAPPLFRAAGVELVHSDVREVVRRTEGWPVGLYLAALAVRAGGSHAGVEARFAGDNRYVSDYLRSEILGRVGPTESSFLTRTSILTAMSGPLCDATLGRRGSAQLLEDLEDRNLLLIGLDARREWYRYHHLFRDLLLGELMRHEPEAVPELHVRAAAWYEANGMPEAAIDHAQAAGDADTVARLVLVHMNPVWASGRSDTLLRWLAWFEDQGVIGAYPGIAVHGSLMFALAGRLGDAEHWARVAETSTATGTLDDGNTVEASVSYLRALLCRHGVDAMRRDAAKALAGLDPASPYRASMLQIEGVSHLLEDDLERADTKLAHALAVAGDAHDAPVPFVSLLLAERGIIAIARDDWDEADAIAQRVAPLLASGEFDGYWSSALVYAWLARVAVHGGDVDLGRDYVGRAARLRHLLTYALPLVSALALLEMTRVYITLGDAAGGRTVLRQVRDIFQQRPQLGVLPQQADELRTTLDTMRLGIPGTSSLTTAELRLVPFLPTHLSFPEIGERLYISRHTVKSQAMSVYRKLGVSSRSEAIVRMHDLGLLTHG